MINGKTITYDNELSDGKGMAVVKVRNEMKLDYILREFKNQNNYGKLKMTISFLFVSSKLSKILVFNLIIKN